MSTRIRLQDGVLVLAAAGAIVGLTQFRANAEESKPVATTSRKVSPADLLAQKIDAHIEKKLAKEGIAAAPLADDAEFLRRVWLDIVGEAPSPQEVIAFLGDPDPEKRKKKVDELLQKPLMAKNWAEFWTDVMEGEATTKKREDQIKYRFREWFSDEIEKNTPFDEIVRKIVSAEGYLPDNGAVGYLLSYTDMGNQPDPKTLAATTARVFMGLQIECAQCHDHPFADWKRDEFMGIAAYFGRAKTMRQKVELPNGMTRAEIEKLPEAERLKKKMEFQKLQNQAAFGIREADRGDFYAEVQTVRNPGEKIKEEQAKEAGKKPPAPPAKKDKDKGAAKTMGPNNTYLVDPAFPVPALAVVAKVNRETDRRETLAKLLTHEKNPFFAKNCANRIWGRLTGRPLVAPSEDMSDESAPHDNQLLDVLAKGFRDLKCDHKQFVRAVCLTNAYARSSRTTVSQENREEYSKLLRAEETYAQGVVRPIDARPLARSIILAITLGGSTLGDVAKDDRVEQSLLGRFEKLFGESNMDPKKYEETIPQALFLMNGQGTNRGGPLRARPNKGGGGREGPALTAPPSKAIGDLLARYEDARERVTRIYLATLCRPPRKVELDDALSYVNENGGQGDVYEDLLWALINSAEFRFNR